MEITLKIVPRPMVSEFQMFAEPDKQLLAETKTIRVTANNESKTRIGLTMQIGKCRLGINLQMPEYKQDYKEEWNYFSGNKKQMYFFKRSKAQDFECFKRYVIDVVRKAVTEYLYMGYLDTLTIELEEPRMFE